MKPAQKPSPRSGTPVRYSVARGAEEALKRLIETCGNVVPQEFVKYHTSVTFSSPSSNEGVVFPCPLKEQDAIAAIKALEACAAAAIADLRWTGRESVKRSITVDLDKSACFLMSAYLTTIDGQDKTDPDVKAKIKDTDLNRAQSILYRRLSANLYKTKDVRYYHIHGSLDATAVMASLGLRPFDPALQSYEDCKYAIGEAVAQFTTEELEAKNREAKGAGIEAISWHEFRETKHGKVLSAETPFSLQPQSPTDGKKRGPNFAFSEAEFPNGNQQERVSDHRVLSGIKVLEMCRVIAGPTIGRSLAAHGASVMKVTSPCLPDVPFFQVDVNTGKHCVDLDLKKESDREILERLLKEADVIIDGYRHGALEGLGYGVEKLDQMAKDRGYGFVYVAEDCFGGIGHSDAEWAGRRGWQQIADCATGVAWAQGKFMGLKEPVIPPFPMSDYGTGALGCIAAMAGLYRRATQGGTWVCRTSLCQYDVFLMNLGELPEEEQKCLRKEHAGSSDESDFFGLRHNDSVDEVGRRALESMRRNSPHIFRDKKRLMQTARSESFKEGVVEWPREAIEVDGVIVGHVRPARNNGFDSGNGDIISWDSWEVDEKMAEEIGLFKGHPECS
ncbi:formyl-CoA:oxalate CoA-transferase [Rhypophila decipiens]